MPGIDVARLYLPLSQVIGEVLNSKITSLDSQHRISILFVPGNSVAHMYLPLSQVTGEPFDSAHQISWVPII